MAVPIAELFISVSADTAAAIANLNSLQNQLNKTAGALSQLSPASQGLEQAGGAISNMARLAGSGLSLVGEAALGIVGSAGTALASLTALGAVGLVGFGAKSFFAAARVSELDTTLRALAAANGLSAAGLQQTAQGIQSMGIEAAAAREITALLVQNHIDLAKGTQLARVAQDAAVISGKNSTDTTRDLVHGIITLNTEVIRQSGLTVDIDQVEKQYAKTLGITQLALTTNQKQTAVLNAVLQAGTGIAGAYAAAMTEPGKVLRSLPRVVNDLQVAFGERLLPEFGPLIIAAFELVKHMGALAAEGQPLGLIFSAIGAALATLTTPLLEAIKGFDAWLGSLNAEAVQSITSAISDFSGVLGPLIGFIITIGARALPIVGKLVAGFNPFGVALAIFALQSKSAREAIGSLLGRLIAFVQGIDFSGVISAFGFLGAAFDAIISGHGDQVVAFFTDKLPQPFKNLGAALEGPVGRVFGVIGDVFQAIIDGRGQEIIDFFGNLLPQPFKDLGAAIGDNVGRVFGVIGDVFQAIIDGRGGEIIDFFGNLLPQPFKDLAAAVSEPMSRAFGAIGTIFDAIISGHGQQVLDFFGTLLPQPFKDLGATIGATVGPVFQSIGLIFSDIVSGNGDLVLMFFKKLLPEAFVTFGAALGENVGHAFDFISQIFTAVISGNGQQVVDFFRALLPQALQEFLDKAGEAPAVINTLAESLKTIQTSIGAFDPAQLVSVGEAIGGSFLSSLGNIGTQLAPLLTVFQSVGRFLGSVANVFSAFAELRARQTAAGEGAAAEDPLVSSLQRLADFMVNNGGLGEAFVTMLGPFGPALAGIAAQGPSTAAFFNNMADALDKFAAAIRGLPPLPDWLQRFLTDPTGAAAAAGFQLGTNAGNNVSGAAATAKAPVGFNLGGGAGGGGNVIINGPISLSGGIELQDFLLGMAETVRAAAGRVNAPPDNSDQPQLVATFA